MRRGVTDEQRRAYAEGLLTLQQLVEPLRLPVGHRTFRVLVVEIVVQQAA